MLKKLGAVVAIAGAVVLAGCGNPQSDADKTEIAKCQKQLEDTLTEAGSDRELTQDEIDACNDADQRAFILGED
ncbi:hypothetical protein [Agromyces allii]|uniref:Entry exclusion lipoprotein TrbK n=1 Tax=Agromyces allii TaxID=393607 RepID=A0ABN2RDA0_9MICO|nr:hypothetical protein [Agromyces allii]